MATLKDPGHNERTTRFSTLYFINKADNNNYITENSTHDDDATTTPKLSMKQISRQLTSRVDKNRHTQKTL